MSEANRPSLPGVDHVVDGLYIAGLPAIRLAGELRQAGITTALKLYGGLPHLPTDFTTRELAVSDAQPIPAAALRAGVTFLQEQVRAGQPTLALCSSGESRSAAFVLAYLLERGQDARAAFALLVGAHPPTALSLPMWQSLIAQYKLPYTLEEVIRWHV